MVRAFLLIAATLAGLYAPPAFACAVLDHADPKVGSEVAGADIVSLTFTGKTYPDQSTLDVTDSQGRRIDTGRPVAGRDENTVEVKLKTPLAPGKYKVTWSVLCDCGAHTPGHYGFTVLPK